MPVPLALRPTTAPPPVTAVSSESELLQRPVQSLDEIDDSRDGRQIRNRPRGEQNGRRIQPVRQGINSEVIADPSSAVRGRNRFTVATSTESTNGEQVTTIRPPRPTPFSRVRITTSRPDEEETVVDVTDVDESEPPAAAVGDMAKSPPAVIRQPFRRVNQPSSARTRIQQTTEISAILPPRRRPGRPELSSEISAPVAAVAVVDVASGESETEATIAETVESLPLPPPEPESIRNDRVQLSSSQEVVDDLVEVIEEEVVEEEEENKAGNTSTKLEIFDLGSSSNTSVVNLNNVVFVPNLDGLQLPQRPTTPAPLTAISSVATSRSVTTMTMSSAPATTSESTLNANSDSRQSKAIDSQPAEQNLPTIQTPQEENKPAAITEAAESSIDELDRFQSELSSKHLTNSFTNTPNAAADSSSEVKPSSTTPAPPPPPVATTRKPFERPRRPFEALGPPRLASTTTTTTTISPETSVVVVDESSNEPTNETAATTTSKEQSILNRLFGKLIVKQDDLSSLLPPDFSPPPPPPAPVEEKAQQPVGPVETFLSSIKPEEPEQQTEEIPSHPPVALIVDPLAGLLPPGFNIPIAEDPLVGLLPPGFKMDVPETASTSTTSTTTESTTKKTSADGGNLFETLVFEEINTGLLPPSFKHHLFTPAPSKTTTTESSSETSETAAVTPPSPSGEDATTTARKGLVFPTRAVPARNATTEKPRNKPTPVPVEIKSGWPIRYLPYLALTLLFVHLYCFLSNDCVVNDHKLLTKFFPHFPFSFFPISPRLLSFLYSFNNNL